MKTENFENFENFLSDVDSHMDKKTRKSQNGRTKSQFEMKCFWKSPKNGKFTYRGDDTQRRIKEVQNITTDNELKALQVQFAIIRKKALGVIIYDNSMPYGEDNVLFQIYKGEVKVNKLSWVRRTTK